MELEQVVTREQADECLAFLLSGQAFPWQLADWEKQRITEALERAIDPEETCRFWIARNSSGIIAAGGVEEEREDRCGAYVLSWGAMHEGYRGLGRGRVPGRFVAAFEHYVQSLGGRLVIAGTGEQNVAMQKFLEFSGYERAGVIPHFYREGEGKVTYYKVFAG